MHNAYAKGKLHRIIASSYHRIIASSQTAKKGRHTDIPITTNH